MFGTTLGCIQVASHVKHLLTLFVASQYRRNPNELLVQLVIGHRRQSQQAAIVIICFSVLRAVFDGELEGCAESQSCWNSNLESLQ